MFHVITCTVHERESDDGSIEERAQRIVFVKEGFAWWAFLFPLLWLLYHRLWLALIAFTAAFVALGFLAALSVWPEWADAILSFGISVLLGLEGNNLRRWTLAQQGYEQVDVTTGHDREECERRFFERWLEAQEGRAVRAPGTGGAAFAKRSSVPAPASGPRGDGDEVIGLFPETSG